MKLRLRPEAREDLREAALWYDQARAGLGDEFLASADAAFRSIREEPTRFQKLHGEVRRSFLHRFPYRVFFLHEHDQVEVLAVLHSARAPRVWKARLPAKPGRG